MTLETVEATAPAAWACYYINGDSDGLESEEMQAADSFADWLGGVPVSCEDAGFIWQPDSFRFWPFGADCQTYTALIKKDS